MRVADFFCGGGGFLYGLSKIWDEVIEELFRFQDKDDSNILNIKDLISLF